MTARRTRILVYYHDAFLPYSTYLVRSLLESTLVECRVLGPKPRSENEIFSRGESVKVGENVSVVPSSRLNARWLRFLPMYRHIKNFRPDIVLVLDEAFSWNVLIGGLAALASRGGRSKVLFYAFENLRQGPPFSYFFAHPGASALVTLIKKSLRAVFFDWLLMPLRSMIVHGGYYAYPECARVIRAKGWSPRMVEQWFPVDPAALSPSAPRNSAALRAKYAISPDESVVGFVGRIIADKGIETIVRALVEIPGRVRLVIVGTGPDETRLRQLCTELGLDERITWCGALDGAGVREHYGIMNLLVLPSRTMPFWKEQLGRVLIEAMGSGLNVAGSSSGAIPYVIGQRDRIFKEGDAADSARVLRWALDHPEDPEALKTRASRAHPDKFIAACAGFARNDGQ